MFLHGGIFRTWDLRFLCHMTSWMVCFVNVGMKIHVLTLVHVVLSVMSLTFNASEDLHPFCVILVLDVPSNFIRRTEECLVREQRAAAIT